MVLYYDSLQKVPYIFTSGLIIFVMFVTSLFSNPLLSDTYQNKINNNDYYKLGINNNEYLIQTSTVGNELNTPRFINQFIPSEWCNSFYSSLLCSSGFEGDTYSLSVLSKSYHKTSINISNQISLTFRASDIDSLKLSNIEYLNLITKTIGKIVDKYNLINNSQLVLQTNTVVLNEYDWTNIIDKSVKNLILDITGVNTDFNQLFYFIKYNNVLINKIPNIYAHLESIYNKDIATLFNTVVTSPNTIFNLFKSPIASNVFNITDVYKDYYEVNEFKPISIIDTNFIKNSLINFNNSSCSYLDNTEVYKTINLGLIQEIDSSISDKQSWDNYINNISASYKTTYVFLKKLNEKIPDLYNFK